MALCAAVCAVCAVCAPGGCRGRVFGAVGPVCVFSIMKVNQKENVQFQGVSQSALVIGPGMFFSLFIL